MDNMNFLHKKYQPSYNHSLSHSRSSRSFLPSNNLHEINPQQNLITNHCPIHTQELIRHMCTDCVQLLCSECIGEHIGVHKENGTFPTVTTLKQLKQDMNSKLSEIVSFMMRQQNHPKCIDVEGIRKQSNGKIDEIRKEMLMLVEDWILKLRNSVVNNVGYEQLSLIKKEMHALQEEVNNLNNSMANANMSVQSIKKAYLIDGGKLFKSYKGMVEKYKAIKSSLEIQLSINEQVFVQALQSCIMIKAGQTQIIKVEDGKKNQIDLPLQFSSPYHPPEQKQESKLEEEECLGLFELPPGSSILSHQTINEDYSFSKINNYNLNTKTYPLNSSCLLPDNMIVISGGMVTQSIKNDQVQIFDFVDGNAITKASLNHGRSSHSTIPYKDKIFFIGGFTNEGECLVTEVLTGDGLFESPSKCKWGGPNLSILTSEGILKITLSGVQLMNTETYEWKQLKSDVPFAFGKGMSIQYIAESEKVYVFGEGNEYYEWVKTDRNFKEYESELGLGNIKSSVVKDGFIWCWNEEKKVLMFDGEWKAIQNQ